jgi:DNA-binding response OmpR family regulator
MSMADAQTIVVVEHDPNIADLLDTYLRSAGFRVILASTGEQGLKIINQTSPALVVVATALPDIDGFEVCRRLPPSRVIPVLFLTSRDGEVDRTLGVELGADDYVTKPFSPREIVARAKAMLRRGHASATADADIITIGDDFRIDLAGRAVHVKGEAVALTTREFDLLVHMASNQGTALARRALLDSVWGGDWYGDEGTVDVHIRQLRSKLGEELPLAPVWGFGYRLG